MTLAQLAKEIREMLLAAMDDPENAEEKHELAYIVEHFNDEAVVRWWTNCPCCGGPLIPMIAREAFIAVSGGQAQFDALVGVMAEFEHEDLTGCTVAYNEEDEKSWPPCGSRPSPIANASRPSQADD